MIRRMASSATTPAGTASPTGVLIKPVSFSSSDRCRVRQAQCPCLNMETNLSRSCPTQSDCSRLRCITRSSLQVLAHRSTASPLPRALITCQPKGSQGQPCIYRRSRIANDRLRCSVLKQIHLHQQSLCFNYVLFLLSLLGYAV